jgi:RNase H-like domain found in reverse transcriptase/Reverse transcriptase (RNA-dependent DNA polymerase)
MFNPKINWAEARVEGGLVALKEQGMHWHEWKQRKLAMKKAQEDEAWEKGNKLIVCKTNFAQEWAIEANKGKCTQTAGEPEIPPEYQWHATVFSEEATKRFLPARPKDHAIKLKPNAPTTINCKVYPLLHAELEAMAKFLWENEALKYIEKTDSPWSTPWFFIKKKDGALWLIQDYCEMNKWTVQDVYPIPWIKQILKGLHGKELFTALDICWGYNNIHIKKEDRWKAAFKMPEELYQLNVMFFGLTNSPTTFQQTMDRVFMQLKNKYPGMIFVYMDDILVTTMADLALHQQIVHEVLDVLENESFFLKLAKCKFEWKQIEYLGIVVEGGTVHIDPTKQNGLAAWPRTLSSVKQVQSTLGVLGYQQPFIPCFMHLARPLTQLLTKEKAFEWMPKCTRALDELIKIVTSDLVLHRPNYDKPFTLEVDASQYAMGAILYQENKEGWLCPVGYHSHMMNQAEQGYNVHDCELLAIMRGLRQWRHLLLSSPFQTTVITDHVNLQYYWQPQKINQWVAHYLGDLADYDFTLIHKLGKLNKADHLSRRPDYDEGKGDNEDVLVLPEWLFAWALTVLDVEQQVYNAQEGEGAKKIYVERV